MHAFETAQSLACMLMLITNANGSVQWNRFSPHDRYRYRVLFCMFLGVESCPLTAQSLACLCWLLSLTVLFSETASHRMTDTVTGSYHYNNIGRALSVMAKPSYYLSLSDSPFTLGISTQ